MARMRTSLWARTPVATLVGVVTCAILILVWGVLMEIVKMLFILGVTLHPDLLKLLLSQILLVFIPDVGFVILGQFIASRLSNGRARVPTIIISSGLSLLWSWSVLSPWFWGN